ncbi:MAG: Cys-Gln thioester bond-forming surface protein [Bacilli bacterium]|nr:Cys-Gln thioester bond-forming surface protein [Bacilli bacterium]
MKKLQKLLIFMLLFLSFKVQANEYSETFIDKANWISGDYVNKEKGGSKKYQQMYTIKRKSDGKFVYCIEPGVSIKDGKIIKGYDEDYLDVTKFTSEEWNRITKLAYYGYGYKDSKYDHTGIHWYTITQFMIWKTVPNGYDIYFTDKLNGKKIEKYTKEMKEMEDILSTYHLLPSFHNQTFKYLVNDKKEITDNNNVLSSFNLLTKGNVSINDNTLIINNNNIGTYQYEFSKSYNRYGNIPIVYIDSSSQNLMSVGDIEASRSIVKVIINDTKVIGHKLDSETMDNKGLGEATLEGAIYGIYDSNDKLIEEVKTNNNGEFTSKSLPSYGKYYIKEIKASTGYNLNSNKYFFEVSETNPFPIVNLYEDVIKGKLEITKYLSSIDNGKSYEKDALFQVYDKNNKLYKEAKSDSNGYILFDLPYGSYTIKQKSTTHNYKMVDDFKVNITKNEVIKKELIDELKESKIKLVKRDLETKEIIKKEISFKIYDLNNKKYLCENDTCTFKTNKDGYFITNQAYLYGNYQIEEQNENLDNYYWNSEPLVFKIDDNVKDKLIIIDFYNKEIKGSLEFTKLDLSTSDPLPNTLMEIYDIDGNIVFKGRTDDNGKIKIGDLPFGKYYLKELEAPRGFMINEELMEFEIKGDKTIKSTMKDERILGIVKIIKIGEEPVIENGYSYIDKRLSNVSFSLFAREDIVLNNKVIFKKNDLVYQGITNNSGELVINDLIIGKYYLKEDKTLEGYLIDDKEYDLEINSDEEREIIIKNYLIKGSMEFTKTSFSTSEALPNTLMEFYDNNDNLILRERTDSNGQILINSLPYGRYYYKELEAPEGYYVNLDKHYFEIKENGVIVKDTLMDDMIIVPDTYKDDNNYFIYLIGGLYVVIKKILL